MTRGQLTLYVVPASHPCAAVELALRRKGLAYRRVDLLPMWHVVHQTFVFGRRTVPGLALAGGEKVVGSRAIMRVLEGLEPEPPLLPRDAAARAKAEAAEAWGDEVLQPLVRRVLWTCFKRAPHALASYAEGAKLPIPVGVTARSAPLVVPLERLLNRSTDAIFEADLAALPAHLDRADAYVAEGVIGGEEPNVGDLQIASSLRLLMTIDDLGDDIGPRPSGALALRLFGDYPGRVPRGTAPSAAARS